MNIEFYKNTSQNNVVDKTISKIGDTRILEPFDNIDILSPNILVNYNEQWLSCNYVYIPIMKRYYYIIDITLATGGRMSINLRVDPLMSYKDEILSATATVIRNERIGITDVIDSCLPINQNDLYVVGELFPNQPFPETPVIQDAIPSDDNQYVMIIRN